MPKIKASKLADVEHRTSAKLTFIEDDGAKVTDNFTVIYRGLSPQTSRAINASIIETAEFSEEGLIKAEPKRMVSYAKYLAATVKSLPDVVDEEGQPVACTEEFFDAMETANLESLFGAVQEGYNPNPSSPSED